MERLRRFAAVPVAEAMVDTPIVVIQGARQVGKSTLAEMVAHDRPTRLVSLDDDLNRLAAREDPVSFLQQARDATLVIDEAQRAPELILPLKSEVDRDRRPGRFLLTGSADLLHVKGVGDSLAGRAESVELLPLSQGELGRRPTPDDVVPWLLDGAPDADAGALDLEAVIRGGYPEAVQRRGRRATAWFDNYTDRLAHHDARELQHGGFPDELGALLRLVATGGMSEVVKARLARELGVAQSTVDTYLRLLRTMRLIVQLPAWGRSPRSRVIRTPKTALADSGLSAHLAGMPAPSATTPGSRELLGSLTEQFVALELLKQRAWSAVPFDLFHYRDHNGHEVDIIVELRDGRVLAIEVKSGQTITPKAWRGLENFRRAHPERDITGIVLHAGTSAAHLHGWLHVLPLTSLWMHP